MSSLKQDTPKTPSKDIWIEPIDDSKQSTLPSERLKPLLFVPVEMLSTLKPVLKRSVAVITSPLPSPSS